MVKFDWMRWLWVAGLCVAPLGCKAILGIEERSLDTDELSADGYEGCQPSDEKCDDCTSAWHTCICEGWKSKPEAVLRKDCAEQAPASIREQVVADAKERYDDYKDSLEDDESNDDSDDAADSGSGGSNRDDSLDADTPVNPSRDSGSTTAGDDSSSQDDEGTTSDDSTETNPDDVTTDPDQDSGVRQPTLSELKVFNQDFCEAPPDGACLGCFCGECALEIDICKGDIGCARMLDCKLTNNCDTDAPSGDECFELGECRVVIQANGGTSGDAYRKFRGATACPLTANCPCSDDMMMNDELCLVFEGCPAGGPACTTEQGCQCSNCLDQCECNGGTLDECQPQCGVMPAPDCVTGARCDGCATCQGACACENPGASYLDCANACNLETCTAPDCGSCSGCESTCECNGGTGVQCLEMCQDLSCTDAEYFDQCEQCACQSCDEEFTACHSMAGCMELMRCMSQTGCRDPKDCGREETCGWAVDAIGGEDSDVMGIVESLDACRAGAKCGCNPPPNIDVTCGTSSCTGFEPPPPDPIAPACCPSAAGSECGLVSGPLFGPDHEGACVQRDWPGEVTDECPSIDVSRPPFNGATLAGCCRPDGNCGYWDGVAGLGCAEAKWFGDSSAYACTYTSGQ